MDHRSDCRLAGEVLGRLMAIEMACRWSAVTPSDALSSVDRLAGWAAAHLAVVVEHGCDCSRRPAEAA